MTATEDPTVGSSTEEHAASTYAQWTTLVKRIQQDDSSAVVELYRLFSDGIRFHLCRYVNPQEVEDRMHDTFLAVLQSIRRGELRQPERLMGFIYTVLRRKIWGHKQRTGLTIEPGMDIADERQMLERAAIAKQRLDLMRSVLAGMSSRDRLVLTRFYLDEQSPAQICEEMRLTDTQFRLLKSRAKARFAEIGGRRLAKVNSSLHKSRLVHRPSVCEDSCPDI